MSFKIDLQILKPMKILLFSRYSRRGASTRLRTLQFLPLLNSLFQIDIQVLLGDEYLEALYSRSRPKLLTIFKAYFKRFSFWTRIHSYELLWVEKELFPWLPFRFEKCLLSQKVPYIIDYDDAEFHKYDLHKNKLVRLILGTKIDQLMRGAAVVLAGNEYLAERARSAGAANVVIIPTVIDMSRYPGPSHSAKPSENIGPVVIGWVGSPATSHYLREVEHVLARLACQYQIQVAVVGSTLNPLKDIDVRLVNWTEETEVGSISQFDIGIMPLIDSPWERGKCGYKLIQYMGCGIPVVASAVGANLDIVSHGENGYLASTSEDWYQFLEKLIVDAALRRKMGDIGYKTAHERFSVQSVFPQIKDALKTAGQKKITDHKKPSNDE